MAEIDVLVVDDDGAIAEFLTVLLTQRGYRVRVVSDGEQALAVLRETIPHVVLLDLTLPVMNGWDLAKAVRESPATSGVAIVIMSAHSDAAAQARTVGADAVVCKPFDLDDLLSCVASFVGAETRR